MKDFIEGFGIGLAILIVFACILCYAYGMYYLIANKYYWRFGIIIGITFCIGCGIINMDGPFDGLLP